MESITHRLSNYDSSDSKSNNTLKLQIQALKQHLHAAGAWVKNGDGKKLDELHEAMEELNFTSKALDQEGIGKSSKELVKRHHLAYDKCEALVKEILKNHDLPETSFLTIEAAAKLRNDRDHERTVINQIITTALKNDVSEEILAEIRRKA